jgi:hypothetical protein
MVSLFAMGESDLAAADPDLPTAQVGHWPLIRKPTTRSAPTRVLPAERIP